MSTYLLLVPLVWFLKSGAYAALFHLRDVKATYLSCLIIAGAPFLVGFIPLPGFMVEVCALGLAIYLTIHYTGVPLFPDGLLIPLGVELFFKVGLWLLN